MPETLIEQSINTSSNTTDTTDKSNDHNYYSNIRFYIMCSGVITMTALATVATIIGIRKLCHPSEWGCMNFFPNNEYSSLTSKGSIEITSYKSFAEEAPQETPGVLTILYNSVGDPL